MVKSTEWCGCKHAEDEQLIVAVAKDGSDVVIMCPKCKKRVQVTYTKPEADVKDDLKKYVEDGLDHGSDN